MSDFIEYLVSKKKAFYKLMSNLFKMLPSELSITASYYLDASVDISNIEKTKNSLNRVFGESISSLDSTIRMVTELRTNLTTKTVDSQFKLTVLNKGASDELIRNLGSLKIGDSTYTLERNPPPESSKTLNTVPTFDVNDSDLKFSSNAV